MLLTWNGSDVDEEVYIASARTVNLFVTSLERILIIQSKHN
jgi:hypothetical protein